MAGHSRYTALIDACVFYQLCTIDALITLATFDMFAPKWTERIENEWVGALERNRPDLRGKLTYRKDALREAVPDWKVANAGYTEIESSLSLPDQNDRHVLAAAICAPADCIVTFNLKDFPPNQIAKYNVDVIHPDDFLVAQYDLNPAITMTALKEMRLRKRNPALSAAEFQSVLARNQLTGLASRLDDALELI